MATTSIIVNATNTSGKSVQKAMTCVNPDATNAQLAELGQMITAVSNHTYGETYRIDKTNCDLEASAPAKPTPTFSASKTTFSSSDFSGGTGEIYSDSLSMMTYNGDGQFFVSADSVLTDKLMFKIIKFNNKLGLMVGYDTTDAPSFPVTFTVGFTETANYKACSVEITLNA